MRALSPPGGVVVLGPTRHAAAPRDLRAFVEGGGGLILCAGGAGQLREFGAEAALLSPVADLEGSASEVEGPLQVDARLRALAQEEPEALPRLRACRAVRPRAGAEVLLGDGARTPLIAQWRVGRGHVIYLGTDELWRLKQRDGALYRALWHELLGRVCAPAAGPPAGIAFPERGQAGSVQGSLPLGTPVRVNVFRATASSLLHVARLEGRVNGAGVSLEEHPHLPEGRCAWQASAEVAGAERVLGLGWWGSAAGVDPKALAGKPARELSREEWAEVEGWRLRKLLAEVARTAGQDVMGLTLDAESPWALQA
ncbi:MAG: hypothetical protein R3F62_28780, partial [Planctomycetota bacterium]